ncbi:MAG: RND family transporter [Deltaproteobacteria bacterium]|nr:RND family transporter [Deltaproteobacteria bacterium]
MAGSSARGSSERGAVAFLSRILFGYRGLVLASFAVLTVFFGWQAAQVRPETSFLRMIPTYHPYIKNFLKYQEDLKGLGNSVRITVETTQGDIFSQEYLATLQKVGDEVFYVPGVNRGGLKSLWTPLTRWTAVTEEGFEGGPVIPDTYDGSEESREQVRTNVLRSGEVGALVANDFKSSVIFAPLQDVDSQTGKKLDYAVLGKRLEEIRNKYQKGPIKVHITGFAKVVGDLIDGASRVALFFGAAFVIMLVLLYFTSRCVRSTAVRAISSIVAVIWQVGFLHLLGYGLNPYSMLVPFLMFALGVSHGIQMGNAMSHEMLATDDKLLAARRAFQKMFAAGLAALLTCMIGFGTLFVIRIGVIQDIAIGASVGVGVVAFTDLMLLPVLMSYAGVSRKSLAHLRTEEGGERARHPVWTALANLSHPKAAAALIFIALVGLVGGLVERRGLKTGDLDSGAPELRPNSRYNLDNAFMAKNYSTSSDVLVVMLETPTAGNSRYKTVVAADRLGRRLRQVPGVQSTVGFPDVVKLLNSAFNEGNLKWQALPRSPQALDNLLTKVPETLSARNGALSPLVVFLTDHRAETLRRVTAEVEAFGAENDDPEMKFLLGAGNAGIEAATNVEIEKAAWLMSLLVYAVVFLVCLVTFRTLRGALCIVAPLLLTSVLCEALMARLGIGVKVATLPVIAVGVGIGVDYGIYIYNKMLEHLGKGEGLAKAYFLTLKGTGKAVAFTGVTLCIGVGTWAFSPIKFQADMGLLLAFMFLWNMVAALCLLPALARFLGYPKNRLAAVPAGVAETA